MVFQRSLLRDENCWPNGSTFWPQRFLDNNGIFNNPCTKSFVPFGVGRRVCIAAKLLIANVFLVLVRFIQKTHHFDIYLNDSVNPFDINPYSTNYIPDQFNIRLVKKN